MLPQKIWKMRESELLEAAFKVYSDRKKDGLDVDHKKIGEDIFDMMDEACWNEYRVEEERIKQKYTKYEVEVQSDNLKVVKDMTNEEELDMDQLKKELASIYGKYAFDIDMVENRRVANNMYAKYRDLSVAMGDEVALAINRLVDIAANTGVKLTKDEAKRIAHSLK